MALNFNVSPYYDDFDPTKNYHRILFKPGVAVQGRELTQSQTILQNQISNFADHIFSQNTPVKGGKITTNLNCYYLKLNLQYNNTNITVSNFLNKIITDETGTVLAKVLATVESTGTSTEPGDPPTLVVSYLSGIKFSDGMLITPTDGTNIQATTIGIAGGTTCTGLSSVVSVSSGIFYVINGYSQSDNPNEDGTYTKYSIGNFVQVNPQTIVLDKYSNTPSYRVGLTITESIVDYIDDATLLDSAVGASNYQAPGADRYKIELTLTTLPLTLGNDDNFIELVRIRDGQVVKQVDSTVYSVIDDYFAKRDFESNGDYVVNDFKITPTPHPTDNDKYNINIGPGVAYIRGYRIENQSTVTLESNRARDVSTIDVNNVYMDYGSYFYVDSANGTFDVTTLQKVDLHCVSYDDINTSNTNTYFSTLVGTAYVRDIEYVTDSGTANSASFVFKTYVTDVNTNTLYGTAKASGSSANTLSINDSGGLFSTRSNAYIGMALTVTGGTSFGDRRVVTSYNGSTKAFTVDQEFTLTPDNTTTFSLEMVPQNVESIVATNAQNLITTKANINATYGKVGGVGTGDTILQNPGYPELVFSVGNPYVANISNSDYVSTKMFRNQSFSGSTGLTLSISSGPFSFIGLNTLSPDTIKQNYIVISKTTGKLMDFSQAGNTVNVSSVGTSVTFTSTGFSNDTVDVICKVNVEHADRPTDGGTVLKSKNVVTGNNSIIGSFSSISGSNTTIDLNNGQVYIQNVDTKSNKISLYTSDVKRIVKIIDTLSPSQGLTTQMLTNALYDVTSQYTLNNGQKDSYYDHAYITPLGGANLAKGNLLVVYDYYSHSGGDGYFSVLSYLSSEDGGVSTSPENYADIPSYTSKSGSVYRLADSLDFRPARTNGVSSFELIYHNTNSLTRGALIPKNLSQFTSSYSYYLGRKDYLVLNKDKSFQVIQGTPAANPIFPSQPDGALVLANITHDPYTAYIPGELRNTMTNNLSVVKVPHNRWAKSDITQLQNRVSDLEYYTSLTLLEQNAQSLQVPDVNGLNRFKNGILVDDFSSFNTADTENEDFSANINIRTRQLMPQTAVTNFQLQNPQVLASLGTLKETNTFAIASIAGGATNIFTLPYRTANVITQPLASTTISVNPFGVVLHEGVALLCPPMDNWVENAVAPLTLTNDPNINIKQINGFSNILSVGDFATVPGTSVDKLSSASLITNTYANKISTYTPVSTAMSVDNGYITNVSILPYIRAQAVGFKVKGLLVNTPISAWFDGQNVDKLITTPDVIELTNVTGKFSEGDIVGFFTNNTFNPTARVLGTYVYPNSTKVRLYVIVVPGTPSYTTTTVLQNASYDSNGNYISGSATATGTFSALGNNINVTGQITGLAGAYAADSLESYTIYKTNFPQSWGNFLNTYGVWSDLNQTATMSKTLNIYPEMAGTYTFTTSSTGQTTSVTANGTSVFSITNSNLFKTHQQGTYTVSSGQLNKPLAISWNVTGSSTSGSQSGFGLLIVDPEGTEVFNTTTPPNLLYENVDAQDNLPYGGTYFTNVDAVQLDQKSSNVDDYYVGTQINITSKYAYDYVQQTATYHPPVAYTDYYTAYGKRAVTGSTFVSSRVWVKGCPDGDWGYWKDTSHWESYTYYESYSYQVAYTAYTKPYTTYDTK